MKFSCGKIIDDKLRMEEKLYIIAANSRITTIETKQIKKLENRQFARRQLRRSNY